MAFDGITVSAIVDELNQCLLNGRLFKIAQPEPDELLLTIKNNKEQYRLIISAGASLPLIYLTKTNKISPTTAPSFCMLLRKYISNGKIISITQPGLERVINFEIEHLNELGDVCKKVLIVELMGKHSNIIFCDDQNKIIDSIKHIGAQTSSVREVLPGRDYFIPNTNNKINPLTVSNADFNDSIFSQSIPISKAIYSALTGISPTISEDILNLADINSSVPACDLSDNEKIHLYHIFLNYIGIIKNHQYQPTIYYQNNEPIEFSAFPLSTYVNATAKTYSTISDVIDVYYSQKEFITRMRQRSSDLRQVVNTAYTKENRKYDLQLKQLKDTEKRNKYQIYGELLTAYGYSAPASSKELTCLNYYTNENITIPLNPELTALENAKKYFDKYAKLKRTYEALSKIIIETKTSVEHLESISTALDLATNENDLKELKEELIQFGYIHRKSGDKKSKYVSKPLHYIYRGDFEIYIGKNNYQNEDVTFKIATGNDWWFHAKDIPGSHVILKSKLDEIPDDIFELLGSLAAYFSKGRQQQKVEIDYTQKKNVKRVNGGAPGFVIYHTNYSMMCSPQMPENIIDLESI